MHGNEEIETNALERIVALLFALADLAERASNRSYPVRCFILWILRRAEVVARDWVTADGVDDSRLFADEHPGQIAVLHHNGPTDAADLARAFRALAHELKRQLRLGEQFARRLRRRKADHAATDGPKSGLTTLCQMVRLVRAIRIALSSMDKVAYATARLDTS